MMFDKLLLMVIMNRIQMINY